MSDQSLKNFYRCLFQPLAWLRAFNYAFVIVCASFLLSTQLRLLVNSSESLPQRYFLLFPKIKPKLNDYTVFYSPFLQQRVIKQLIGIEGDWFWLNDQGACFLNSRHLGPVHRVTETFQKLHPTDPQLIPEGHVFLYSPHPRSFDSRYQEIGVVPRKALEGKVIPLW